MWVLGITIRLEWQALYHRVISPVPSRVLEMKTRASLSSVCIPSLPDSIPKRVTFSLWREYMCITGQCGDGSLREFTPTLSYIFLSDFLLLLNFILNLHVKSLLIKILDLLQKEKEKKTGKRWSLITKLTRRLMADTFFGQQLPAFIFPCICFCSSFFWNSLPRYVAQAGLVCRDWSCALSHPVVLFTDWETSHYLNIFMES